MQLQSWTKGLGHIYICGAFRQFTHATSWMHVSRIFLEFQHCIEWGARELRENFEKDAWFYKASRYYRKLCREYCITVPRTPGLPSMYSTTFLSRVHPEEKRRLFTRPPQQMIRNCRMFSRNFLLIPSLGLKR